MANTAKKNFSFYLYRSLGSLLLSALAAVFIYSALSKLDNIQPFEWTFIDLGISNMLWASVIAHVFIGFEILIAAFLLFHIYLKQVTYPIVIAFLTLLTIYLIILIIKEGNNGNCGCFGDWLYMHPSTAIWKNLGMIAVCFILMRIYPIKPYKHQEWIAAVLAMTALVATFLLSPLITNTQPDVTNEPLQLNLLYTDSTNKPIIDLHKGKHIIAFMSLTCPHCKKAAYLLHILKEQNPELPVYLVIAGNPSQKKDFFAETKATNLPYLLFKNMNAFQEMAGEGVPAIYWVNNGIIERKSTYLQLDPSVIKDWLKK